MNKNTLFVLKSLKQCVESQDDHLCCIGCSFYPLDNCQEELVACAEGVIDTLSFVEKFKEDM